MLRRVLLLIATICIVRAARATEPTPVIEPGREAEVLALFAPYRLTGEVTPGWKLWNVNIRATEIEVELHGPDAASARLVLGHPSRGRPESPRSASFVLQSSDAPAPVVEAVLARLRANDHGGFWREPAPSPKRGAEPPLAPAPARGLAWPLAIAALTAGAMLWLGRRA